MGREAFGLFRFWFLRASMVDGDYPTENSPCPAISSEGPRDNLGAHYPIGWPLEKDLLLKDPEDGPCGGESQRVRLGPATKEIHHDQQEPVF